MLIQDGGATVAMTTPNTSVMEMPIKNTTIAARNLPSTMPVRLTGAVSSAWSVFCRFSSLNNRMVRIGSTRKQA